MAIKTEPQQHRAPSRRKMNGWLALSPLLVFLAVYVIGSLVARDFYKVPVAAAFIVAGGYAFLITRGVEKTDEKIAIFSEGAGSKNVLMMIWIFVLAVGTIVNGIIGWSTGVYDFVGWMSSIGGGIGSMGELIIVSLLAGGLLEMIRYNGGMQFIIDGLTRRIAGRRAAAFSIAGLVSLVNICTANNTIAIITVGPLAKDISERFGLDPRKTASILDTFSCLVQGILPYGAQMLMAAGLSGVSAISISGYLFYPYALGLMAVASIVFRFPRKYS